MPIVKAVCEPQEQSTDAADSARPARDYKALFSTKWIVINSRSLFDVQKKLLYKIVKLSENNMLVADICFYLTFVLLLH